MSAGQGRGILLRLESLFTKFVLRRELVGVDDFGNKYYRFARLNHTNWNWNSLELRNWETISQFPSWNTGKLLFASG